MKSKTDDTVLDYVAELRKLYPDVEVAILPGRRVRVKVSSPLHVGEVIEKAAELQTRWIIEHDIYILVSVTGTGPIPVNDEYLASM